MEDARIVRLILRRLLRKSKVGAAHTDADNMMRGVRGDLRGRARGVLEGLIKSGYVLSKRTPYGSGLHVSINPGMFEGIQELLSEGE